MDCPNHIRRTKSSIKKRIMVRRSVRSMFGEQTFAQLRTGLTCEFSSPRNVRADQRQYTTSIPRSHTPSNSFRHLPLESARFSYATERVLFISTQLGVWVLITLRSSLSGTFLQTLPDLVTPLKGHSLPATRSAPSERFGY